MLKSIILTLFIGTCSLMATAQHGVLKDSMAEESTHEEELKGNFSWAITGFAIASAPSIKNKSQYTGRITLEICLDKNANLLSVKGVDTPDTEAGRYLEALSIKAVKEMEFTRVGEVKDKNYGTIGFNYGQ